ncbi:MAG: DEAD/DEAH box helicase [Patescibacteria group bacterium]
MQMYSKNRISSRPQGDASDRSFKTKATTSPRTRGFSSTPTSSTTRVVRQTRPYVSPTKSTFSRGGTPAPRPMARPAYDRPAPSRDYAPRSRGGFDGGNNFPQGGGYDRPAPSRGGFDRPAFRPGRPSFGGPVRGGFGGGSRGGFGGGRGRGPARGERIDHAKFIYKPDVATLEKEAKAKTKKVEVQHTFADFKFDDQVKKNLVEKGYENPTPIQDQTIMYALKGQDVLGLANTGSGKTAAFLLPLIDKVLKDPSQKVIILAPTRELAMQINKEFEEFAKGMKIFSTVCVGGMPIFRQIQNLRMVNHFIIGTPGRIKDLAHRRCIIYSQFNNVVLDEVDHMLDMGFVDDITEILKGLNPVRQSLFFSATMPPKIRALVQTFQKDPHVVDIAVPGSTKTVEQDIIKVRREDKFKTLCDLIKSEGATRTIIFVETKREVEEVANGLTREGFKTGFLHGDKRQRERARTLDQFKTGISDILVATDVAARGIDVKDVSHVINYTVPQTHDDYVHRIGRAGRAGRTGKAFTFV